MNYLQQIWKKHFKLPTTSNNFSKLLWHLEARVHRHQKPFYVILISVPSRLACDQGFRVSLNPSVKDPNLVHYGIFIFPENVFFQGENCWQSFGILNGSPFLQESIYCSTFSAFRPVQNVIIAQKTENVDQENIQRSFLKHIIGPSLYITSSESNIMGHEINVPSPFSDSNSQHI